MRRFVLLTLLFLTLSTTAYATETYECVYTSFSDQKGNHKETMNLTFIVDKDAGKSYMVGNNGSEEVLLAKNASGLGFIEVTGAGNVMTTAISNNMDSVHSRNSMMADKIVPSQYYGSCTKK